MLKCQTNPKCLLQKAMSNFAKSSSTLSGTTSPMASISWLIQALDLGRQDCMLLLKHTEGSIAKPRTGISSEQVTKFKTAPSVIGSRLLAEITKRDKFIFAGDCLLRI